MKKYGAFLFGAMLGGITGTLIAMLLAPSSGEEIRIQIKDYQTKLADEVRLAAQQRRQELEEELAKLRSGIQSIQ